MTKLFVGIPCYGGQMHGSCTISLLDLDNLLNKNDIKVEYQFLFNESLIPRARNYLVNTFLKSSCTHLLFIDADIQFNAEDIFKMIKENLDIIGGVYAKKEILWDNIAKCVKNGKASDLLQYNTSGIVFLPYPDSINNHPIDKPVQVEYIGTGMMLIKREVFDKIKENNPTNKYDYLGNEHYCYFDCKIKDNNYLSEDYYFCNSWNDLGGKVYAALWTKSTHNGTLGLITDLSKMVI